MFKVSFIVTFYSRHFIRKFQISMLSEENILIERTVARGYQYRLRIYLVKGISVKFRLVQYFNFVPCVIIELGLGWARHVMVLCVMYYSASIRICLIGFVVVIVQIMDGILLFFRDQLPNSAGFRKLSARLVFMSLCPFVILV